MIVKQIPPRQVNFIYNIKAELVLNPNTGLFQWNSEYYDIEKLSPKSIYLLDYVQIYAGIAPEIFYSMIDVLEYQLYTNDNPLFNKPNYVNIGVQQTNHEIYTAMNTQVLKLRTTGTAFQIGANVGYTSINVFFNFNLIQITNEEYQKKFWGGIKGAIQ